MNFLESKPSDLDVTKFLVFLESKPLDLDVTKLPIAKSEGLDSITDLRLPNLKVWTP